MPVKKIHIYYILYIFLLSLSGTTFTQVPERPNLYYVTVDPETGNDRIVWFSSPSPNVSYYIIGIAEPDPPDDYHLNPERQVFPPDTVFINTNSESGWHPVGYSVWAVDDQGAGVEFHSDFDDPDSTIYLQPLEFDSCNATIALEWSDYNTWRGNIAAYNIYRRIGAGIYSLLASVNESMNTYTLANIQANEQYELFVEAVHTDNIRRSTSNLQSIETEMTPGPDWINADYATISPDNTIALSFTIGSSGTYQYQLMRSSNAAGPYTVIDAFESNDTEIQYTDDIPFESGVYYYKLAALNNCGLPGDSSNCASNILLSGSLNNLIVNLNWNHYYEWNGGIQDYTVTRTIGTDNPVADIVYNGLMTSFNNDISGLVNHLDPYENRICYRVEASENMNIYGIQGASISNLMCFSVNAQVRVPNAIIPNDTEPLNRVFEPVFEFAPEHYEIVIYNRSGIKIWEGSEPWDGRVNGDYVAEGVYLYYIRLFNHSSDIVELTGKLTVVFR